jgi:hypothetical protein
VPKTRIDLDDRRSRLDDERSRLGAMGGAAVAVLLRHPKDMIAGALAIAAVGAILSNALFLQAGHHPSPMFAPAMPLPAAAPGPQANTQALIQPNPLPKPRPSDADPRNMESRADIKPMAPVEPAKVAAAPAIRPPAAIPAAARRDPLGELIGNQRRVAAVQRALTDYGYGQLKATGVVGTDTQAAITRFERDHKLPPTGQVNDRLVRELASATGRAID